MKYGILFSVLFICKVTFKSWYVINFHHCTDIGFVIIYFHYIRGAFRVLKQIAVGALNIVSTLFPNTCFLFELSVLPYFPSLSGPHCEMELPKRKRNKRKFLVPWNCGQATIFLQCFLFTPPDIQMCPHLYSTFFLSEKTLANFVTKERQQKKRLIDDSQIPKGVLEIVVCK